MIFTGWCCFDRLDELMNRHEHLLIMKKGRWAFNADGVVLPSPSTSVEESLAYFNSNGLDVWYMTTFLGNLSFSPLDLSLASFTSLGSLFI